jgi:hypothetical protein
MAKDRLKTFCRLIKSQIVAWIFELGAWRVLVVVRACDFPLGRAC